MRATMSRPGLARPVLRAAEPQSANWRPGSRRCAVGASAAASLGGVLGLWIGVALTSTVLAHDGHEHPVQENAVQENAVQENAVQENGATAGNDHAKDATARGTIFDDRNGDGVQSAGEPGIPDVGICNGTEIVRSDSRGRYEIPVDQDDIVFVIKPRGWMTAVSEDALPAFYYIHKPAGSPPGKRFPGVPPTGPLPESIDFPLRQQDEPERFKALFFGDPQSRNVTEVEYMTHDVIEQIVAAEAHGASFGVTLGDIVFDDLDVFEPHNQAVALVGIPWYNVIGNHDVNRDATADEFSDETFESVFGPAYYSFDYGPTHFLVLDNVNWIPGTKTKRPTYEGGFGADQLQFIKNDLASIPPDQLVVIMMHIPLPRSTDRESLYRLIEQRPATVSISAHQHFMEHQTIDAAGGWKGPQPHHHIINVTVCGSWWAGQKDERGLPHATMSDGAPNGYSIMEFDGNAYSIDFRAAGRPADHQMVIHVPEAVDDSATPVLVNLFNAPPETSVRMRVRGHSQWSEMKQTTVVDPRFVATKIKELALPNRKSRDLPRPHQTNHMWIADLPADLPAGTHLVQVRADGPGRSPATGRRIFRVTPRPE